MTTATHAYVVFSGTNDQALAEHWQFGIRYKLENNLSTPATFGSLPTFDIDAEAVHRDETDWTIDSSWNAGVGGAGPIAIDDWLNDQLLPAVAAFFTAGQFNEHSYVNSVKVSPITSTGHVGEGRTAIGTFKSPPPQGTNSSGLLPLENTVVASWSTPVIGPKGRGRIYLPYVSKNQINTAGKLDSGAQSAWLDDTVTFLEATAITSGILSGLWALPIVTGGNYSQFGQVTGARMGDVVDTQRRRRRQEPETYAAAPVSY